MTTSQRYELRSGWLIGLGCFAAAFAGAELGGAALQIGGALLSGTPLIGQGAYDSLSELIFAEFFWNAFLLPGPLMGLLLLAWPGLTAIGRRRPGWLHPRTVYAVGVLACVAGECLSTSALVALVSPLAAAAAFLSGSVMGVMFGVPASIALRLIVLRRSAPLPISQKSPAAQEFHAAHHA